VPFEENVMCLTLNSPMRASPFAMEKTLPAAETRLKAPLRHKFNLI